MHIVDTKPPVSLGVSGAKTYTERVCVENPERYGDSPMAKFDIEKAMEIAQSGDEERIRRLFEGIQERLTRKRYGLVWERGGEDEDSGFEAENVVLDYKASIPYPKLRADLSTYPERADGNMLLEGDNYIWLKILEQTHAGKIDFIYADVPYNTGNKDFKYNDKFVDPEDTFKHSKWIDFMSKRFKIAKELLTPTGVMFISCDDREYAPLKLLCADIFGEDNIETMIWHKVDNDSGKLKVTYRFRIEHEYILVIYSDKTACRFNKVKQKRNYKNKYTNPDNDPRGAYKQGIISSTEEKSNKNSPNYYEVVTPGGKSYWRQWRMPKEEFDELNEDNRIYYGKDGNAVPSIKMFINEPGYIVPVSILEEKGTAKTAGKELEDVFGYKAFTYPKPVSLIRFLLEMVPTENATILDFFAGSGTTAQAVEELNRDDNGNRQWILVTNNEDQDVDDGDPDTGICRDITKPRMDIIITGYRVDGSQYSDGTNSGYQYFQYDFIKRDRNLYERNADRFFKPYIVDALIPIKHGVARTLQDGTRKLCVYESSTKKIIALFANTEPEDVQAIVDEYFSDDEREHILLLPEETSAYKAILKAQVKNGVDVQYHHNLISTADYLE